MSLQNKILLPIVLLIIILVGGSGFLSYQKAASNLQDSLSSSMKAEAQALQRALHNATSDGMLDVARCADLDFVRSFAGDEDKTKDDKQRISNALGALLASYPMFERFSVIDSSGKVVASTSSDAMGIDFSSQEYFLTAKNGNSFLSLPYRSGVTNPKTNNKEVVITLAAPIKNGNKVMGVFTGTMNFIQFYKESVMPVSIGSKGFAYVLAPSGLVAMHKNPDFIFNENISILSTLKELVAKGNGQVEYIDPAGVNTIAYMATEPDTKMVVVIRAERDDIFSGLYQLRNEAYLLVVVAVILGIPLVFIIVRPVVRALQKGMHFAADVAAGKLDGSLDIKRNDEIGKLAIALRAIPASLKQVVEEYNNLELAVESGNLNSEGDEKKFSGEFSSLIKGTNSILKRFRLIINNIPSPMVMLNRDLKATFLNTVAQDLAGSDYAGKTCEELFCRDDYGSSSCALMGAVNTRRVSSGETVAHPRGKSMDIRYTAIPMQDSQGNPACVLQFITDLTEIKTTQRRILEVVGQATDISDRVATSSEQLSAQMEQISHGTGIQRDRVGSTAAAMEEMNSTVLEVARSAGQASDQAEATRLKATDGAGLVSQVTTAINNVNNVAQELQNNMKDLGTRAEGVGGVMNVISDIADQTNLLALNAAIEAARAGDAGRGFAVVADEVRKLAEKTMSATQEVGSSISAIQNSARNNIAEVGEAVKSISEATELANSSGRALKEIVDLAAANSSVVASIATAAEEQSATSEEISHSIEEINRIVSDTTDSIGQSSSAVRDLAHLAQELRVVMNSLK